MRLLRIAASFFALLAGLLLLDSADYAASAATSSSENHDYHVPPNFAPMPPPPQPVSFSHAQHAGTLNLPCATCHVGANVGANVGGENMTLPDSSICMNCHRVIATDSPAIQQLAEFDRTGGAIGWVRVYSLLSGVNWSHRPHLSAGIDCQACHGDVMQMEVMSVATAITAMSSCISCHRARDANAQCETCHAWPSNEQLRQWSGR
ncbi:MAG: cytochrome c family protein [Woeseiaceae bacterium]|nr:cytochrome c family protein [Woeseiaceae bacterium]